MKTAAILAAVSVVFSALSFTGCASGARAGKVGVSQSGDAATPAHAASETTAASLPIPAGSVVETSPGGAVKVTLSAPSTLSTSTTKDTATGPQSFAPPSPSDKAAGSAALWMRLGLVAGLAAGAFGLVKGWEVLGIGGGAVAAACFIGLALDRLPVWLWIVLGAGGALAVAGPALWHLKLKRAA